MFVYRLTRKRHPIVLSGIGASIAGGRWNTKGVEIIYCTEGRALAMAEILVHLSSGTLPNDYLMSEIEIPKSVLIECVNESDLPEDWNTFPPRKAVQKIGDLFILSKKACVLKVPSAVIPQNFNYLINPNHHDFNKIKVVSSADFPFDVRLVK